MRSIKVVRVEIRKKYRELKSWEAVGQCFGLNRGMAWRIAKEKGYEPKDPKIRRQLGLPAMGTAPTCPECGEMHVSNRCLKKPKHYRTLWDTPRGVLRKMLEEREEIGGDGDISG